MPRRAVRPWQPRIRLVAGHEVPVVLRAGGTARRPRTEGPQRQIDPPHGREPRGEGGIEKLVVAAVRAAVVAPEPEIVRKWFSWRWLFDDHLVERLVSEGRLERVEPGWVTAPASA